MIDFSIFNRFGWGLAAGNPRLEYRCMKSPDLMVRVFAF